MHKLSTEALGELLHQSSAPAVSIYLPTHRQATPPHKHEDQTRYKNRLRHVATILHSYDAPNSIIDSLLARLEALHTDQEFWQNRLDGLAVFASPKGLWVYDLPLDCEEYSAVDTHFHVAPLLALVQDNLPFLVLALNLQTPRLYQGDMYGLEPVTALTLPHDLISALKIDEFSQRQQHYHVKAGGYATGQHGGGTVKDTGHEEKLRFLRLVDEALRRFDDSKPLILAGATPVIADYRSISSYPHVLEGVIEGDIRDDELVARHEQAWTILSDEYIQQRHQAAVERLAALAGQARVTTEPAAILDAAETGRIDTLLVSVSTHTRDTVRDVVSRVKKIIFPAEQHRQFIDQTALLTWYQGGQVLDIEPRLIPVNAPLAAILRY